MSRRVPVTIVGSSVISFSLRELDVLEETSRLDPRTITSSSTPTGCSVTFTRNWTPARSSSPSVTAGAKPSFETTTL